MADAAGRPARFPRAELPRRAFVPALLAAVLVPLAWHALTWGDLETFTTAIDHCAVPMCDFVRHYDPMGRAVFEHHGPVPGFIYPPGFAVALGVLGALSPVASWLLWLAVQFAAIVALAWCGWALLDRGRRPVFLLYVALLLTSYPVLHNLKWGQVSAPITAMLLIALVLARRPSPRAHASAGLLLAAAVGIKLYPALFAPAVLGRGHLKAVPWFLGGCVLFLFVVPVLALGMHETAAFYHAVFGRYTPAFLTDVNAQYWPAVVDRWLHAAGNRDMVELLVPPLFHPLLAAVSRHAGGVRTALVAAGGAVAALNAWLVLGLWRRGGEGAAVWTFVLIALTVPFVVPTSWPHYFSHLPFCQAFVLHHLSMDDTRPRAALAKALLLVLPSACLSNVLTFNAVGGWLVFNYFGLVFGSSALLLLAAWATLPRAAWAPPWRVTPAEAPAAAPPVRGPRAPAGSPSAPA